MDSSTTQPKAVSPAAREVLARPLDTNTFTQGLAVLKDRNESLPARCMVLDKIHGSRRTMDSGRVRQMLDAATALAKDPQQHPSLSAQAIGTMASLNLLLVERGELKPDEAQREAPFLLAVAQDRSRDREMRGRAIRAIADLKVTPAVPVLQSLLADPANQNLPEVARNGCLALARLNPDAALPAIAGVMSRTTDRSVFGSAAFALGRIKTAPSLAALNKLKERFPDSDSCEAALAGMEDVILAVLKNPQDPNLVDAIRATRYLWKKDQREKYVPLLHALLQTAPPPARGEAVERLLAAAASLYFNAENQELEAILSQIADQDALSAYAARIRRRLAAQPLAATDSTLPVPASPDAP